MAKKKPAKKAAPKSKGKYVIPVKKARSNAQRVADTKERLLKAIQENTTRTFMFACKKAAVDRMYAYDLRDKDPKFDAAVKAALLRNKESIMDGVENQLHKIMLDEKNPCKKTLRWYADRQGKSRGYVTRQENININHKGFTTEDLAAMDAVEASAAYAAMVKATNNNG